LAALSAAGCRALPQSPSIDSEKIVLRVWDTLDAYYGSETSFECMYLPVLDGRIEIVKPYAISKVTVLGCSPVTGRLRPFRLVRSNPGENEFVIEGTTLYLHPCHENQSIFVAWVPDLSEATLITGVQKGVYRK